MARSDVILNPCSLHVSLTLAGWRAEQARPLHSPRAELVDTGGPSELGPYTAHDMSIVVVPAPNVAAERRLLADRIFRGALLFNTALTAFWAVVYITGAKTMFFSQYAITRESLLRVTFGFLVFSVLWGLVWYGVKNLLLKYF